VRLALFATAAMIIGLGGPAETLASGFSLTDGEGVTHYTNAPNDPRYRRVPGLTGTAAGWLRLPQEVAARFGDEIREISGRHGVDPGLVQSVIRAESAFNPHAVSIKGAQGLMQLMPRTAQSLGVRNSFDPRENIEGGVRHLRYLMDRFPGNLPLAIAAYNAGEGAVQRYQGIPPYAETQQYVQKVLALSGGGSGSAAPVFKYELSDGTVTYTNVPPSSRQRLR
jgi:hypothetical protein